MGFAPPQGAINVAATPSVCRISLLTSCASVFLETSRLRRSLWVCGVVLVGGPSRPPAPHYTQSEHRRRDVSRNTLAYDVNKLMRHTDGVAATFMAPGVGQNL